MRLAVVGSRDYPLESYWVVRYEVQLVGVRVDWDLELVSGGARGVDSMAEQVAQDFAVPITVHKADWKRYGRAAGHRRNALIVADADEMLAFYAGAETPGTASAIRLAREKGIPVSVFGLRESA